MRPRRSSTLGDDPLAAVFPPSSTGPAARQEVPRSARAITVGVSLDPEVLERARNAVYWTPGLTLTALATTALAAAVDDLEHDVALEVAHQPLLKPFDLAFPFAVEIERIVEKLADDRFAIESGELLDRHSRSVERLHGVDEFSQVVGACCVLA